MSKIAEREEEEEEQVSLILEDILESIIFTRVPLIDLVSTSRVSKSWKRCVSSSLNHFNKTKPWFLIHTQTTKPPFSSTSHAHDPRSAVWVRIQPRELTFFSVLRSSHSTLLYMLSPSKFSFSFDPLHLTWHHINAPLIWRTDPVVAVVGHRVVVAGGICDFEDDPLAVEIYDMKTKTWDTCPSMPDVFRDSASSMWLSIAVDDDKLYVAEKSTGLGYRFDPETKSWFGPYNLSPDQNVNTYYLGFSKNRLILIGLIRDSDCALRRLKLWELNHHSMDINREICEMPCFLVEKLRAEDSSMSSVVVNVIGDFVFIVNPSSPEEVCVGELGGVNCSWRSVKNPVVDDKCRVAERLVFTCCDVGLEDLQRAVAANGRRFSVVEA